MTIGVRSKLAVLQLSLQPGDEVSDQVNELGRREDGFEGGGRERAAQASCSFCARSLSLQLSRKCSIVSGTWQLWQLPSDWRLTTALVGSVIGRIRRINV